MLIAIIHQRDDIFKDIMNVFLFETQLLKSFRQKLITSEKCNLHNLNNTKQKLDLVQKENEE